MFRRYFQSSTIIIKSLACFYQPLGSNPEYLIQKRWAGHSKWQNIKSTKQALDMQRAHRFGKLTTSIFKAVKQGGSDPNTNTKLKGIIAEASKANMPKATIESAIKRAMLEELEKPYWVVFTGPKGLVVGVEVTYANKKPMYITSKVGGLLKKINLKIEPHLETLCDDRGVVLASPKANSDNSYEKALEDGIEIGVNEVFENDDKTLIFECTPDRLDSVCDQLTNKEYTILSASSELDFKEYIKLTEEEIKTLENVLDKLQSSHEEIIRVTYNISQ